jgi:hypothetical protein
MLRRMEREKDRVCSQSDVNFYCGV